MYAEGKGVPNGEREAVKWHRKAAEHGMSYAQARIAEMYEKGQGIAPDETVAVRWLRLAAEGESSDAQLKLGSRYETGQGVEQDYAEAYKYYLIVTRSVLYTGDGMKALNSVVMKMHSAEIEEGQRRAAAFVPRLTTSRAP